MPYDINAYLFDKRSAIEGRSIYEYPEDVYSPLKKSKSPFETFFNLTVLAAAVVGAVHCFKKPEKAKALLKSAENFAKDAFTVVKTWVLKKFAKIKKNLNLVL